MSHNKLQQLGFGISLILQANDRVAYGAGPKCGQYLDQK